jgi:uncharacterized protein involved in exopolysaccharide biosynthesis
MAKYVEILFRFKVRFAFLLVVLPAIVGTTTILLMPSYKASATLWVDSPSYFGGATPSGWSIYLTPAQNEADTFNQQMGTREFGNQLYKQLADRIPDPTQRVHAVATAKLFVLATGTHLLSIVGSCDRPQICVTVVDTAITVLRNQQIDLEKAQAKEGSSYLAAQLQQVRTSLSTAEDALRRYVAAHPGAKFDGVDPALISDPELARLASDVQSLRSSVGNVQGQLERDNSILTGSTAVIAAGPRVIDPPQVTSASSLRGRLIGDGSNLKKAGLTGGATLALGLGYLFLMGWLDKSLRDPREIERRFKLPVVATIPELLPAERF